MPYSQVKNVQLYQNQRVSNVNVQQVTSPYKVQSSPQGSAQKLNSSKQPAQNLPPPPNQQLSTSRSQPRVQSPPTMAKQVLGSSKVVQQMTTPTKTVNQNIPSSVIKSKSP